MSSCLLTVGRIRILHVTGFDIPFTRVVRIYTHKIIVFMGISKLVFYLPIYKLELPTELQ